MTQAKSFEIPKRIVWEAYKRVKANGGTSGVDETSFRVERKNHRIHVYSSGGTTLKLLYRKRGIKAIDDLNIIPRYGRVIIHDGWQSYLSYDHCGHGLCGLTF